MLWPEWICSVQVVWDFIREMCGTRCPCPAPLDHRHTVNPVRTSCVLLAACAQEILEDALHMWGSTEGRLKFTGYAAALDLLHLQSWLLHDQRSSMEDWSKTPVAWSNIWTSRNVRQTASVLWFHLGKTSRKIKSRSRRKPGWTNRCQNLSLKDVLFSRALLGFCLIRIKFQWFLDYVIEQDEAFFAKLKMKNTKGTCYWVKNFFLLEPSSPEIWKILSKCKSYANMPEYRSETGKQWVSFASFAGGHPQRYIFFFFLFLVGCFFPPSRKIQ